MTVDDSLTFLSRAAARRLAHWMARSTWTLAILLGPGTGALAAGPEAVRVESVPVADRLEVDGAIEAIRGTTVSAQVAGAVLVIDAQAGQAVRAGQVLLRLDAEGARQARAAADAQVREARSALALAQAELKRQKTLHAQQYISQAAYDQVLARYQAARERLFAQRAQALAAEAQTDHFLIRAPYDGIVATLEAHPGDMALPGRPLATLFDPSALRIEAQVPQYLIHRLAGEARIRWPPGLAAGLPDILPIQTLPTRQTASLTGAIRLALPRGAAGPAPGTPVRLSIEIPDSLRERLRIPSSAVVRRGELTGAYVLDERDAARLRQIRLGLANGPWIEVLSGLRAGERVLPDAAHAPAGGREP
ncbi:efflux RND transporter periplasmic adaptor subunit [Castellaniella sp. GW247-6E4]|uniref:efflux RND transporter periplasmic adaptor subunit n=1 Tax=Castellaniella sp. GW247-6E4 TaxID=3140380 RepID=UPI0033154F74